jgi:hypothetical protein
MPRVSPDPVQTVFLIHAPVEEPVINSQAARLFDIRSEISNRSSSIVNPTA